MRIEVSELGEGGKSFANVYQVGTLTLDDVRARITGNTETEGRASRKNDQVRVRGRIRSCLEVACDRCLCDVPVIFDSEFDVIYVPANAESEIAKLELQSEDLEFGIYEGETIDAGEIVREQILLNLPSRTLCKEECSGLCSACGADLNAEHCGCEQTIIDPRWSALKEVISDKQE